MKNMHEDSKKSSEWIEENKNVCKQAQVDDDVRYVCVCLFVSKEAEEMRRRKLKSFADAHTAAEYIIRINI